MASHAGAFGGVRQTMSDRPREHRLLHPSGDGEETRRANIRDWLLGFIDRVEVEYDTGAGPADVYLPNRRIIIEVKRKGRATPDGPAGSQSGETCLEQLTRYINSERTREQRCLDDDDNRDVSWIGILTDCQTWHVWEFGAGGPKIIPGWSDVRLQQSNVKQLAKMFDRRVGLEWAPADPTEVFRDALDGLKEMYCLKRDERDTITQRELWLRQLRMSGTNPAIGHEDDLFILHTMLTVVAARISEMYGGVDIRYGFASWVKHTIWLDGLTNTINQYNWKQQTGDVLRALYMGLVDKKDRHIYGEYYTPDWLAEKICADVIDDEYLEQLLDGDHAGGVMDPACGSGTFLYYAARRIVESNAKREQPLDDHALTNLIIRAIHGIDIHPVAVAMSKANVLRAIPEKPSEPLRIYQGDSLQVTRATDEVQQRLDDPGRVFNVTSRKGVEMRFPLEFVELRDFDGLMHVFAQAAVRQECFPASLEWCITEDAMHMLRGAFDILTNVCRDEGNGIWAWYMIQQVSLYKLRGTISRVVANPPWVRVSNIQDVQRKHEVDVLARELKVWVGGKNATGFNIAALFVVQCLKLYGMDGVVSGWVLPDAAMRGENWAGYAKLMNPCTVWDLGDLPFPKHAKACVHLIGSKSKGAVRLTRNPDCERPASARVGSPLVKRCRLNPYLVSNA